MAFLYFNPYYPLYAAKLIVFKNYSWTEIKIEYYLICYRPVVSCYAYGWLIGKYS